MASGKSEENETVRAYFTSFAPHSRAYQTKLTTMQPAIISTTKCAHGHHGAYHTNDQLCNEKDPLTSRFGTCKNVIQAQSKLVFDEKAKGVFCCIFDATDKTRQDPTKLTATCTDHFEVVC